MTVVMAVTKAILQATDWPVLMAKLYQADCGLVSFLPAGKMYYLARWLTPAARDHSGEITSNNNYAYRNKLPSIFHVFRRLGHIWHI